MVARRARSAVKEPVGEEDGMRFEGRAVFFEPPKPPDSLVAEGGSLVAQGNSALEAGENSDAERAFRAAIERFVDAFLLDRHGYAGAFTEAHRLGRFVSERFGCAMQSTDGKWWRTSCGVLALHQRLGTSIAGSTKGRCSICFAEDFGCDHVPGRTYEGTRCIRVVYEAGLDEISLVPFPDDPRCYRVEVLRSLAEIETSAGELMPPGASPVCVHCQVCPGAEHGPSAEDVDQTLWETIETPQ